jgi:dienelactone hydrolase
VSWYEAAAYAAYAGMSLPTLDHWEVARGGFTPMVRWPQLGGFAVLAPFSNFGTAGPVPVGSLRGITSYGAYDMPGNVREWCWNATPQGRIVRGGAWEDNAYAFDTETQAPAVDRSPRNGIRLAFYPDRAAVPEAAFTERRVIRAFDPRAIPRVSDDVFRAYRERFSYDRTPLDDRLESSVTSPGGWTHEVVSFDAAYGGERILAHVFLPSGAARPFQAAVYFPGSASTLMPSSEDIEGYYEFSMFLSYLVRSGRAVVYPVYKGTFERGGPEYIRLQAGDGSHRYVEYVTQVVQDVGRTLDYLETRPDIDRDRLALYGMSWGGRMGAIITALEPRFRASVLLAAGAEYRPPLPRPEARGLTYAPRVRTPTLILNGRYDGIFPAEASALPLMDLLGTPAADKKLILYETDHIPPRTEYVKETLAWLDRYLGPVRRVPGSPRVSPGSPPP